MIDVSKYESKKRELMMEYETAVSLEDDIGAEFFSDELYALMFNCYNYFIELRTKMIKKSHTLSNPEKKFRCDKNIKDLEKRISEFAKNEMTHLVHKTIKDILNK
jgi:hypothetical protein